MPRVPTREQRVQEKALSAPNANVTLPIGGMISASNRASAVGQRLAQDAENYFIQAQSKADDLRVQKAVTDFHKQQHSLLRDYKKTQLDQAMDSSPYLENLNRVYEENKGLLANERQVEKFRRQTVNLKRSYENQVQQHADNERQKYDNLLTKQAIDFEIESFLDDPSGKTADKTIMAIEDKTARYFARNGLLSEEDSQAILKILDEGGDPRDLRGRDANSWNSLINHPKFKEARKESENRLASGIIDKAFASGDTASAGVVFKKNKQYLTAAQKRKYEKALEAGGVLNEAFRVYDKISEMKYDQQKQYLKNIKNGKVRKQVAAFVSQGKKDRQTEIKNAQDYLFQEAYKFIDSNKGSGRTLLEILPKHIYSAMNANDLKKLNERLKVANVDESKRKLTNFELKYSDDDIRQLSSADVERITVGMTEDHKQKVFKKHKEVSEGKITAKPYNEKDLFTAFREFGYTNKTEQSEMDDDEFETIFTNFVTAFKDEVDAQEQLLDRKLTRDEQRKLVNQMLAKGQIDDWFGNTRLPAFEIQRRMRTGTLKYEVKVDFDEISPTRREEIKAMIKGAKLDYSEYQVEKIHKMMIMGQYKKLEEYLKGSK